MYGCYYSPHCCYYSTALCASFPFVCVCVLSGLPALSILWRWVSFLRSCHGHICSILLTDGFDDHCNSKTVGVCVLLCVHLPLTLLYYAVCVCLTPESITGWQLSFRLGLHQKAVTYTPITVLTPLLLQACMSFVCHSSSLMLDCNRKCRLLLHFSKHYVITCWLYSAVL